MTDEELRTLVNNLVTVTANQAESIEALRETQAQGFASLQANAESQARSIEALRESQTYNTEIMANALELCSVATRSAAAAQQSAAAAQGTAAAAMELAAETQQIVANTSRNLDRLERDIADLKQIVGIVINDNQADRARISRIENQE